MFSTKGVKAPVSITSPFPCGAPCPPATGLASTQAAAAASSPALIPLTRTMVLLDVTAAATVLLRRGRLPEAYAVAREETDEDRVQHRWRAHDAHGSHLVPAGGQRPARQLHDRADQMGGLRRHRRDAGRTGQSPPHGQVVAIGLGRSTSMA